MAADSNLLLLQEMTAVKPQHKYVPAMPHKSAPKQSNVSPRTKWQGTTRAPAGKSPRRVDPSSWVSSAQSSPRQSKGRTGLGRQAAESDETANRKSFTSAAILAALTAADEGARKASAQRRQVQQARESRRIKSVKKYSTYEKRTLVGLEASLNTVLEKATRVSSEALLASYKTRHL